MRENIMHKQLLEEMLYCLSDDRHTYYYFKDKYCMFLLNHYIKEETTVRNIKNSHLARFCNKPLVKEWLANQGQKIITPEMVETMWSSEMFHFTLTLGEWGGGDACWQQTARTGFNLVVQLNFSRNHDRLYSKVMDSESGYNPFVCESHPINGVRNTVAWARLDISEDLTEVLIEEVQNDWLRYAWNDYKRLVNDPNASRLIDFGFKPNWNRLEAYFNQVIKPLISIWDEAILCATLEYIVNHIGAEKVYMYDHMTGLALKSMYYSQPPKSLYTQLPRKFGFERTVDAPRFIQNNREVIRKLKKIKKKLMPQWHYLNLNKGGIYA